MKKLLSVLMAALLLFSLLLSSCAPAAAVPNYDYDDRFYVSSPDSLIVHDDIVYSVSEQIINRKVLYFIKYYDQETGERGYLCGKPDCEHNSADCNAYISDWAYGIFAYGEKLYSCSTTELIRMNYDGTDHEIVKDLVLPGGDGHDFISSEYGIKRVFPHRGNLYILGNKYSVNQGAPYYEIRLAAVPLSSRQECNELFYKRYDKYADCYCCCRGDYIYLAVYYASEGYYTEDTEPRWVTTKYTSDIYRYCISTGTTDTLLEAWEGSFGRMWCDDGGSLYFWSGLGTASRLENGQLVPVNVFQTGSKKLQPVRFENGAMTIMLTSDGGREMWVQDSNGQTVFRGTMPLASIENAKHTVTYKGFVPGSLYFDFKPNSGQSIYHVRYDLTESGLKETLLWVDE